MGRNPGIPPFSAMAFLFPINNPIQVDEPMGALDPDSGRAARGHLDHAGQKGPYG